MTRTSDFPPGLADPAASSLFEFVPDPETGTERYLLDGCGAGRTVPLPTPTATIDGRYWWVLTRDVDQAWTLSVADLTRDTIRPATTISRDGPLPTIDPETGVADIVSDGAIKRYDPRRNDAGRLEPVRLIDIDRIDLSQTVAGLTRSCDGDRLGLLVESDGERCVATLYLPSGAVDIWHSKVAGCDVVRFSPTDPTLLLYASETPIEGTRAAHAWLAREGLGSRPLDAQLPSSHRGYWWQPDGSSLRYVDPERGIEVIDLELGQRRTEWVVPAITAHGTRDGRTLAAAIDYDGRHLLWVRTKNESTLEIAPLSPPRQWKPQPAFEAGDRALVYTTVANGQPRPAVTPLRTLYQSVT